jgi:hypothetical protein
VINQQSGPAPLQRHGEEIAAAFETDAPVVGVPAIMRNDG